MRRQVDDETGFAPHSELKIAGMLPLNADSTHDAPRVSG
jgi:hypothetical protein